MEAKNNLQQYLYHINTTSLTLRISLINKKRSFENLKNIDKSKKTVSYAIVNFKFYSLINKLTLFKGSCF